MRSAVLIGVLAAAALAPAPAQAQSQDIETGHFFVRFTSNFANIWDDAGSGANVDVSFWAPRSEPGYFTLGHLVVTQHALTGPQDRYVSMLVRPKAAGSLAAPTDYVQVWNDGGSGANRDVAIWNVVCPPGYISMGDVATSGGRPNDPALRCVNINYTARIGHSTGAYWTDAGSGADGDVAIWTPKVTANDAQDGYLIIAPSTFQATHSTATPPTRNETRAMRFDFPGVNLNEQIDLETPRLVSQGAPPPGTNPAVVRTYPVPFFLVDDPNYPSQLAQWRAIPTYTVERTTRFEYVTGQFNRSSSPSTKRYTKTIGSEQTSNWSTSLGISSTVGVSGGIEGVVEVSASLTLSSELSQGGSSSASQSQSVQDTYTVAPGKYAALFQVVSDYRILRPDGSTVPNTQANNRFDDTAVVEFGAEPVAVTPTAPTPAPTPTPTPAPIPVAPTASTPASGALALWNGAPYFGSTTLSAGFSGDPSRATVQAGGTVSNPLTGAGCVGYVGAHPDYVITYTAGSYPLTISAAAASDLSLVVRTPGGVYYCDDDSGEGLHPKIYLPTGETGEYRIWVGTYSNDGGLIASTLAFSEIGRVAE